MAPQSALQFAVAVTEAPPEIRGNEREFPAD